MKLTRLDKILMHNDQFGLELRPWKMITEEDCPHQSVAQKEHHHPPSFVRVKLLLVMKSYFEFGHKNIRTMYRTK